MLLEDPFNAITWFKEECDNIYNTKNLQKLATKHFDNKWKKASFQFVKQTSFYQSRKDCRLK